LILTVKDFEVLLFRIRVVILKLIVERLSKLKLSWENSNLHYSTDYSVLLVSRHFLVILMNFTCFLVRFLLVFVDVVILFTAGHAAKVA
jgi:hypothetical protein